MRRIRIALLAAWAPLMGAVFTVSSMPWDDRVVAARALVAVCAAYIVLAVADEIRGRAHV